MRSRLVRCTTLPPSMSRSSAVTSSRPDPSARCRCSNHAELSGPLENNAPRVPGFAPASTARRSCSSAVAGSARCGGLGRSGSTASISWRTAMAYATPDGFRTLSSSTRQPPYSLRTRSKPWIAARTVLAGRREASSRHPGAPSTDPSGSTPSARMRRSPYTSARNASIARARWMSPASSSAHSYGCTSRGTRSTANGRFAPATPKSRPCEAIHRSRVASRSATPAGPSSRTNSTTSR